MKEKRHLVMWVEVIALAVLLARLETVRIRENAKEVQEYACAGREQEGAQKGYGKREEKTVSDKVIGARNRRSEKKLEDTLEKNVTEKKKAALTFDDGPNSKYTPLLLKGLKERGVHATFFLMGKNIEGKEALVKQIQEEGHLIGNHTYNHVQLDKISKEAAKEEIETTNQKIFEITGVYPAWLRPPYGEWRKNLDFYVEMFPVLWDVDTLDNFNLVRREVVNVPLVGTVAAGQPILAVENVDGYFPIPAEFMPNEQSFMLKVKGDSMINAGIFDGDQVLVKQQPTADNGDIVVALVEDSATVKTFYKEKGYYRLQPENDTMDPIIITGEIQILGKVFGVMRFYQ